MQLYFVRHGESEANIIGEFSNRGLSYPLTARGVAQAEALAAALATRGVGQIYASPLLRAAQTAAILARATGAPVETVEALRELDVGELEGTRDPEGWARHDRVQDDWFIHGRLDSRLPGGESFLDIRARFVPFVEQLLGAADMPEVIALVGHGGLYRSMLPFMLPNVDRDTVLTQPFPNAAYVLAEVCAAGLRCREWCGAPVD